MSKQIFTSIEATLASLDAKSISEERKSTLRPLIEYIQECVDKDTPIRLNFICTHNSRRSHLSQIWAQTIAAYYKVKSVYSYSGGTEATAMFPVVKETLINTGFQIALLADGDNPIYSVKFNENSAPIIGFSKTYDNAFNPQKDFAAIMTCSSADKGCPFIAGATKRIPITFEDPKAFDNTPLQIEKYQERSLQIATELKYVFSLIKNK
ncbi:MAG: low molecular weight phosphatase family protein [Flavicella sp.]